MSDEDMVLIKSLNEEKVREQKFIDMAKGDYFLIYGHSKRIVEIDKQLNNFLNK